VDGFACEESDRDRENLKGILSFSGQSRKDERVWGPGTHACEPRLGSRSIMAVKGALQVPNPGEIGIETRVKPLHELHWLGARAVRVCTHCIPEANSLPEVLYPWSTCCAAILKVPMNPCSKAHELMPGLVWQETLVSL